jgi:hypothetical protein
MKIQGTKQKMWPKKEEGEEEEEEEERYKRMNI